MPPEAADSRAGWQPGPAVPALPGRALPAPEVAVTHSGQPQQPGSVLFAEQPLFRAAGHVLP